MSSGGRKPARSGGEEAEVDALLRAAQDAVLLKLRANSHLVSSSSAAAPTPPSLDPATDPLDADLARRFDALRSGPPPPKRADAPPTGAAGGGMDALEARFAALKGAAAGPEKETRVRLEDLGGESSEDEDDEVEKLMRWAMDAARLDVDTAGGADKAKPAEEEEKDEKSSVSSEDDDDDKEDNLELERKKRKETMSKNKPKSKWFFL